VIPASAQLLGTVRTVSEATRARVTEGLERVAAGIATAHGLEAKVHVVRGYPVTVNDAAFARFVGDVARELAGPDAVVEMSAPLMGAEDFSYILERVPGAMAFLGARPAGAPGEPLHSNRMLIDESAMARGIALHAAVARRFLAESSA
jgi:metal-dependent amidase/aminoacylase/carboxypeptidase family protein